MPPHLRFLQLGIAERRPDIAMTEHPLDDFDTLALRNELAAARISELVRCISSVPSLSTRPPTLQSLAH